MTRIPRLVLALAAVAVLFAAVRVAARPARSAEMTRAAAAFLDSLDAKLRERAVFRFEDAERKNWAFVPKDRLGVPLSALTDLQKNLLRRLLSSALSEQGLKKVDGVIALEGVLRELEGSAIRDPEKYYVTVFGTPDGAKPWGWRYEGHHLALNFCSITDDVVSVTPLFLGANPGEVEKGPRSGLRLLTQEEDLARTLVTALDDEQRPLASPPAEVPADVLLGPGRAASFQNPQGIPGAALREEQQALLMSIVEHYARDLQPDAAEAQMKSIRENGPEKLFFLYLGGTGPREPHYWRVQGTGFAIELDNTQNGANHPHTLWRDFKNDFGEDLLRQHLQQDHAKQ